jgi:RHS repeat-associated protein
MTYDALSRPVTTTTPHTAAMQPSVVRVAYNEASLLETLEVNIRGASTAGVPAWTPFIADIDYDAKGQRRRVELGNGAVTTSAYDPASLRLVEVRTRRPAGAFPADCPAAPVAGWPGCDVRNVHYTYDPVGNVTRIRDDAQQSIFFANQRVEPSMDYRYDALYRLVEAGGREHLGQAGGAPIPHSADDAARFGLAWGANDGTAMGTYLEEYVLDVVGNLIEMRHRGSDPANPGWNRTYAYDEPSRIEDGSGPLPLKTGNRLTSTTVGTNNPVTEPYVHDAHGNIVRMPHLGGGGPDPNLAWDEHDQLRGADLGGGGAVWQVHDSAGRRVRKVREKSANLVEERIYLNGFEIFRRHQGANLLERETLHVMDGNQRVALVETRTADTAGVDTAPLQVVRYQLANHLGSATVELDAAAAIVSYEEFSPYGSTTYQAVRSTLETPRRYRFAGKERDEETGLSDFGARLYAPWLGRWIRPDPAGVTDDVDGYVYARGNPVVLADPDGRDDGYALKPSPEYRLKLDPKIEATIRFMQMNGQLPLNPSPPVKPAEPKIDLFDPKAAQSVIGPPPPPTPPPNPLTQPPPAPPSGSSLNLPSLPKLNWEFGNERNKLKIDLTDPSVTYKHSNFGEDLTLKGGTDLSLETSKGGVTNKFTWNYGDKVGFEAKVAVNPHLELKLSGDTKLEFHVGVTWGKLKDLPTPNDVTEGVGTVRKGINAIPKYNDPLSQVPAIVQDKDITGAPKGVKPLTKLLPSDDPDPAKPPDGQPPDGQPQDQKRPKPVTPAWSLDLYAKPGEAQGPDPAQKIPTYQFGATFTFQY